MKKRGCTGLLIGIMLSASLWADGGEFGQVGTYTPPTYIPGTCRVDPNDPFDPDARLIEGPHAGQCIDTRERRSVQTVKDSRLRFLYFPQASSSDLIVANVYHEGRYWVARIPANEVRRAILQVQYFPVSPLELTSIAHTQVAVQFFDDSPMELVEQSAPEGVERRRTELSEIVFSIEVVGERGPGFNALKGMQKHFVLAYRLVSLEEKIDWMITKQDHHVAQWKLNMSYRQLVSFVYRYVERADSAGMAHTYHTVCANCSNVLADILDEAIGRKTGRCLRAFDAVSNLLPFSLGRRGLIQRRLPSLNSLVESP